VAGRVYGAPPGAHLLVQDGHAVLSRGPRENRHRPSVDALFRSAAHARGERVTGVVLSGARDDGTAGLGVIKAHGGYAIVQDPEEASYEGMPASAIASVEVDRVLPVHEIPGAIVDWLSPRPAPRKEPASVSPSASDQPSEPAEPVPPDPAATHYGCPDCGGVLTEVREAGVERFRCHTGHLYSLESLVAAHGETVEYAMWAAVRSLQERGAMLRRVSGRFAPDHTSSQRKMTAQADEAEAQARLIRDAIEEMRTPVADAVEG